MARVNRTTGVFQTETRAPPIDVEPSANSSSGQVGGHHPFTERVDLSCPERDTLGPDGSRGSGEAVDAKETVQQGGSGWAEGVLEVAEVGKRFDAFESHSEPACDC